MGATTQLATRVRTVVRIESTALGNPRFRISTDHGSWNTAGNHSFAFDISPGLVGRSVLLVIDGRQRITDMVVAP